MGVRDGEVELNPLYKFQIDGEIEGRIVGHWAPCGVGMMHVDKLAMSGFDIPVAWGEKTHASVSSS
ncbi:hypothetical protein D3C79_1077360 [compost metagenome]